MKNILILHGKEGSPNGSKVRYVRGLNSYNVHVLDYKPKEEPVYKAFPRCVAEAKNWLRVNDVDLIIGSSFGGGVLLQLVTDGVWSKASLFLAQAGVMYGVTNSIPAKLPAILIHGKQDGVVSFQDSVVLANRVNLAELWLINDDHRLKSILAEPYLLRQAIERLLC